jgi:hypothetical protein
MNQNPVLSKAQIESLIFSIRGTQVMIDRDLAEIYQVETRVLNQAVKRNINRFPERFRFQLNHEEIEELKSQILRSNSRSQIVTLNQIGTQQGGNIKYQPYAFTEQGIAMLATVLRSDVAVQISIQIMDAFVEMRKFITNYGGLLQRMEGIERKQIETNQKFEQVFKALESRDELPTQGIFFDSQIFDAYAFVSSIIKKAKKEIILIDNYIDESTLTHLSKKGNQVSVIFYTKNISKQLALDIKKANEQYGNFAIQNFEKSHGRFLIIDNTTVYHLGASLKDLGKKWFAFTKMDAESVESILNALR